MAVENFTTYTEVDPNSRIAKTATRVTHTDLDRNETAYVYLDKTADYFAGDFTHLLTVYMTALSNGSLVWAWGLANTLNDFRTIDNASGDFLGLGLVGTGVGVTPSLAISECDAGTVYSDSYTPATLATPYYLKIVRDESVGDYGTLYCYIYSDSARTALLDTLTLTLHTSKKDFRYIYAVSSDNFPDTPITGSGYTENLHMTAGETSPYEVFPAEAITRVTSLIHRYDRGTFTLEVNLGEVVADFGLPEIVTKPKPAVEKTPEEKLGEEIEHFKAISRELTLPEVPALERELREADPRLWAERDRMVKETQKKVDEEITRLQATSHPLETRTENYVCPHCGARFSTALALTRHIEATHPEESAYSRGIYGGGL